MRTATRAVDVLVTSHCFGNLVIWQEQITFTTPDLDAGCGTPVATDIFDLARWASWLAPQPYGIEGDYNCDGTVDVFDFGVFAGGLAAGCTPATGALGSPP